MRERIADFLGILKYGILLLIAVYILLLLISEGKDAPMENVQEKVLAAVSQEGMRPAGTQDLKQYYGLNAGDLEAVCLYLPDNVMSVNELLLARTADDNTAEAVIEAARNRLETQKENFDGYGVEQTKLLNSAVLEQKGNYVLLIVGADADKALAAFKKIL